MLTRKKIFVVVLAYRDEGDIRELYRKLRVILQKITPNWEIIYGGFILLSAELINDGYFEN